MSATSKHQRSPADTQGLILLAVVGLLAAVVVPLTAAVHLANRLDGSPQHLPNNPITLVVDLIKGRVGWPSHASVVLLGLLGAVLLLAGVTVVGWLRGRRHRTRVDRAAQHMGRGRDLGSLAGAAARTRAARLSDVGSPGLLVGKSVAGGQDLWQGWEDVSVDIWGPRTGKTTSRAIPALLAAPGAAVATSNKRDLVDATRDLRADHARRPGERDTDVWVFDPQGIVDEPASWWWNPLTYVTDETKAANLADVFTSAAREPGARTDAYFDPRGEQLLADMLLAAALAGADLTQVYLWLTRPTDDEPVAVLREHGYPLNAASVDEAVNMPDKQRGGVYGTAQKTVAFMTNRRAMRWVTPSTRHDGNDEVSAAGGGPGRRVFDPDAFVRSRGTLYSLSKEGRGSAGPIVTALTVAVAEAAEQLAKVSPGGRLAVPMTIVLDEAANVCRWRELPSLYSHYGSRGIVLMTILQSWSQGVEVWGLAGMRKLWSAANVKTFGGGVHEREFLSELSELVGEVELQQATTSHGRGGRSTSLSTRRERILDVADLGAMPAGRALVIASGARPTLARTLPWMDGPAADAVRASIRAHDPAAARTLSEADSTARRLEQARAARLDQHTDLGHVDPSSTPHSPTSSSRART